MRIENIKIRNFRSLRRAELRNLPRLAVVVGANGSGKSTLFDVFTFLKDALTHNVGAAVARRGGYRELVSRGSDGTIKMFAYLILLYDPKPHPLLAVEEPENQLYPDLLLELVEEFRDYAKRGGQVFVSTHSSFFLNGTKLDEVFWLVKQDGFTEVRRAANQQLLKDLVAEGDKLGTLWRQGLFEGAGPSPQLVPEYQKISGARVLANHLTRERNRSHSFRAMLDGIVCFAAVSSTNHHPGQGFEEG